MNEWKKNDVRRTRNEDGSYDAQSQSAYVNGIYWHDGSYHPSDHGRDAPTSSKRTHSEIKEHGIDGRQENRGHDAAIIWSDQGERPFSMSYIPATDRKSTRLNSSHWE